MRFVTFFVGYFVFALIALGQAAQSQNHWQSGRNWYFNFLPSSNINKGSRNTELSTNLGSFQIETYSQNTPGYSVVMGWNGFTAFQANQPSSTIFSYGLSTRLFEDLDASTGTLNLGVNHRRRLGLNLWSVGSSIVVTGNKFGEHSESTTWNASVARPISQRDELSLSMSLIDESYTSATYLNGTTREYSAGWVRSLSSDNAIQVETVYTRGRPRDAHQQYDTNSVDLKYAFQALDDWQTNIGAAYGKRDFIGIYPLQSFAREDQYLTIGFSTNNPEFRIANISPNFNCLYTYNTSNIDLFDFAALDCAISLGF